MRLQFDRCQFGIADFNSFGVNFRVHRRFDEQAFACRRVADQIDHRDQIIKRLASPVLRDERKQSMFDFVPFTRARWKMTNRNVHAHETRQFL